jgi:hypothetical protein
MSCDIWRPPLQPATLKLVALSTTKGFIKTELHTGATHLDLALSRLLDFAVTAGLNGSLYIMTRRRSITYRRLKLSEY